MDTIKSFKGYGKVDELEQQAYQKKTRKRIIIITVSSIVLIAVIIAAVAGVVIHNRNNKSSPSSDSAQQTQLSPAASLKAVCKATRYPDSCFSSISSLPESNTTDPELLFKLSLRVAIDELYKLSSFPSKLRANAEHDARLQKAIDVCSSVIGDALDRLNDSISALGTVTGRIVSSASVNDVETEQFKTIGEALKLVKKKSEKRFSVYVKEGSYVENIDLDKNTWNVMIYGDGKDKTVIVGSRNFIDGTPTFETATFEYQNNGPGADVSKRVKWAGYKPTLTDTDADRFTVESFIQGPDWLPNAAVQFDSTL
ncbi:Pectinesterase 3 [Vigna angularis]|uniref:Pectinesterase n=1 Tax=Phaseolus angularis TaxID=3914 RepID=A0A8T0JSA1_PHAAN|nr:Pectinesterase 3 [Vigna angularis]